MRANLLERAGAIGTPCRECQELVFVSTDGEGYVIDITLEEPAVEADEEESPSPPWRAGAVLMPLGLLAGVVFVAWMIANTSYCSSTLPGRTGMQASGPVPTPSPVSAETPAPAPTRPALPKVMRFDSLNGINFAPNQAALPVEAEVVLVDVAERLKTAPAGALFEIGGHTDNQGSERYNKRLSLQRAESVRQFLIKRGVPAALLRAGGYGGAKPVVSNESELGREQNRRIEITRVK